MGNTIACRSCGALIFFAKTEAGKQMPLDAKPTKAWTLDRSGQRCRQVEVYAAHWATCPSAQHHRRKAG